MEDQAMRFLNTLGNKFFSRAFTYLLEQRFKTRCAAPSALRKDYDRIAAGITISGVRPFGDSICSSERPKLDPKIVEIPIRYRSAPAALPRSPGSDTAGCS
jgi:hypothetical protein